jgi:ubiquinone/menaquinone biosynthesis C-methylase UbiE
MKVADVGCGSGFFTIPMARIVGASGKVFAVDVQEEIITIPKKKIQKLNIRNVETVVSEKESIPLPAESVDLALKANVLHELESYATVREVYRLLKPGGVLAILEWEKKKTRFSPPLLERLTLTKQKRLQRKQGLRLEMSPRWDHIITL